MSKEAYYSPPNPTTAYVSVAADEEKYIPPNEYELTATAVNDPSLFLDRPAKPVREQYAHLPEVHGLTWTDNFFDTSISDNDSDSVIAVFDFDYDKMEDFHTNVGWVTLGCTLLYTPLFTAAMLGLVPCYLRQNVRWNTRAQHVAITRDGIRFVRDKRPSCWGWQCTDQGKVSKTVPFDMITDCDIEEPAGNTCFVVQNVLTTVNVDTASSGTEGKKELRISGLKNPHAFKKLVWAMKRSQGYELRRNGVDNAGSGSTSATAGTNSDEVAAILREIRDELRQNNELLQKTTAGITDQSTFASPSSGSGEEVDSPFII